MTEKDLAKAREYARELRNRSQQLRRQARELQAAAETVRRMSPPAHTSKRRQRIALPSFG